MRDLSDIVICRPGGIARAGLALVATAVLMTALQPGTAQGRDAGRDPKAAESAGPVFARIASAFEDSDAAALAIIEIEAERQRLQMHPFGRQAGALVHQRQRNVFVRLQIDDEAVGHHLLFRLRAEDRMRQRFELDDDLRLALR